VQIPCRFNKLSKLITTLAPRRTSRLIVRIFHILDKNYFDTGSVHQMFQAAEGFRERGHDVMIVSRPGEEMARRTAEAGIEFLPLPLRNGADIGSIKALRKAIREHKPDVIHVHKGGPHTLALAALWPKRVPAFIVNRGVSFPLTLWNRLKYRTDRVDRIVNVCEDIRKVVIRTGKIPPEKAVVIYAGTDTTVFDPERWDRNDFRREKSIHPEAFLIMQIGVRDWKGWRELIDAFAVVHRTHPEARLALIAFKTAEAREQIVRYSAERGVADKVIPVEPRNDMARVLNAADCVVDASWAGTGITGTIREAMALRKPVIATDAGGNRELLSSSEVGWLIPQRDEPALVRALLEVMENPDRARGIGERAREHVRAGFSRDRRLDALEKLYREVIDSKKV
jgi:glycosyltransferase involved in cell wall biosynthesis